MKAIFFRAIDNTIQKIGVLFAFCALSTVALADDIVIDNHTVVDARCTVFNVNESTVSDFDVVTILNKNPQKLEKCDGQKKFSIVAEGSKRYGSIVICELRYEDQTEYIRTSIAGFSGGENPSPCILKYDRADHLHQNIQLYCKDQPAFVYGETKYIKVKNHDAEDGCRSEKEEETSS